MTNVVKLHYTVMQYALQNVIKVVMKKVQCTFRLPQHIVDKIDEQEGETRTDKLLALLGKENTSVMHNVVDNALHEKIVKIEARLSALEKPRTGTNLANEKRREETLRFIEKELSSLTDEQKEFARLARYPLSEVRKATRITKSQSDTYKDKIREYLGVDEIGPKK